MVTCCDTPAWPEIVAALAMDDDESMDGVDRRSLADAARANSDAHIAHSLLPKRRFIPRTRVRVESLAHIAHSLSTTSILEFDPYFVSEHQRTSRLQFTLSSVPRDVNTFASPPPSPEP